MPERQTTLRIPSVHGGISHQPAHLRFPHQVEVSDNTMSDIASGTHKRPGSEFVKDISGDTGTDSNGNYRLHLIERDENERYLVVYGQGDLLVYEIVNENTILKSTVTISSAAAAYLASGTPTSDDLRLETITDLTVILNTKVAIDLKTTPSYVVTRGYRNFETMVRDTLNVNDYARIRADEPGDEQFWQYTNGGETATFAHTRMESMRDNEWSRPNGAWTDPELQNLGFTVAFQRFDTNGTSATWNASAKTLTHANINGYSLTQGEMVNVTGGTGVIAGWYEITSVSGTALTLENRRDVDGDGELKPVADSNNTDTTFAGIGKEVDIQLDFDQVRFERMHDIADAITEEFRDIGIDAIVAWKGVGSKRGFFRLTSPYRGSKATITGPTLGPSGTTPLSGPGRPFNPNVVNAGTGTATLDQLAPEDRWTRVSAPSDDDGVPDETTMPLKLQRDTYAGDGATAATFTCDTIPWVSRKSGNKITNPAPKAFDADAAGNQRKVADVLFLHNRLWLAAGERVMASQTGDFFNFFQEDHDNLVDSDPIDRNIAGSSDSVNFIDFMVPFRRSMLIFSKAGHQFEGTTPDVISPSSFQVDASTSYKTLSIRPKDSGLFIYFLAAKKDVSALMEYFFDDGRAANDAADLNRHVAGLLDGPMRSICTLPNINRVMVLPKNCNEIFVYSSFWQGNQKEHSAWDRWVFDSSYRINDIASVRNDLYVLVEAPSGKNIIEMIPVDRQLLETIAL